MYYINAENMLKAMSKPELVQLTNDEPRATEPDMAVVDEAIRYASDLVDGYLRGRYPLPNTNPLLIKVHGRLNGNALNPDLKTKENS